MLLVKFLIIIIFPTPKQYMISLLQLQEHAQTPYPAAGFYYGSLFACDNLKSYN